MQNVHEYAVIFTYNFDTESEVTLFGDDYDGAKQYLKESFEKELKTETDDYKDVESTHEADWTFAAITTHGIFGEYICEYRLCTNVRRA